MLYTMQLWGILQVAGFGVEVDISKNIPPPPQKKKERKQAKNQSKNKHIEAWLLLYSQSAFLISPKKETWGTKTEKDCLWGSVTGEAIW